MSGGLPATAAAMLLLLAGAGAAHPADDPPGPFGSTAHFHPIYGVLPEEVPALLGLARSGLEVEKDASGRIRSVKVPRSVSGERNARPEKKPFQTWSHWLPKLPSLAVLELEDERLGADEWRLVAGLKLETLHLNRVEGEWPADLRLHPSQIARMRLTGLHEPTVVRALLRAPKLKTLWLGPAVEGFWEAAAQEGAASALEELWVFDLEIGARASASLPRFPALRRLRFLGCRFDLAILRTLPVPMTLEALSLHGNRLDEETIAAVRARHPRVKVLG